MVSVFFFFLPNCFLLTSKFTHVPLCVCINNKLYMGMQRERRSTDAAVALSFLSSARSVRRFAPRRCSFFFFYPFVCEKKKKKKKRQLCSLTLDNAAGREDQAGKRHMRSSIYIYTHTCSHTSVHWKKSFPFCCCSRAQMWQFLFKKRRVEKKKRRRRKGKCGTVMSPFFFF